MERACDREDEARQTKREYTKPELTVYGDLTSITTKPQAGRDSRNSS